MARKELNSKGEEKEMTLEEAKAWRASLYQPKEKTLSEQEKREAFRMFWAKARRKYGKSKELEQILWIHLQVIKCDVPEKFEDGINHFGLKKLS